MEIHPTEMSRGENDYRVVIEGLTSKICEGVQKAESLSSACIYRVPERLCKLNESAYTPQLIAIGPLHRNDPHLRTPMQLVKVSYMNRLICRMTQGKENREEKQKEILQDCVAAMEKSIDDAKKCYAEEVALDAEMMLVDGCFILEFLYKYCHHSSSPSEGADPIFANSLTRNTVQRDLLLLENQIPFLVLEKLYPLTLARIHNNMYKSLNDYVFLLVEYLKSPAEGQSTNSTGSAKTSGNKMNNSKPEQEVSSRNANYHHILHKIHDHFRPHDQTGKLMQYMPFASELLYAGVKFESGTGNDQLQVKFTEPEGPFWWCHSARFEIPSHTIGDSTEPSLRNFIAFEQCCPDISPHFTSYATVMNMLVNSDIDVQVLETAGVVDNWLGVRQDVTVLFNKLCKGVVTTEFFFANQCNRATMYSKRFWPKNIAYLRSQYFASPWKFIAFCLGFIYFGLTIAQLIVSIKIK